MSDSSSHLCRCKRDAGGLAAPLIAAGIAAIGTTGTATLAALATTTTGEKDTVVIKNRQQFLLGDSHNNLRYYGSWTCRLQDD
jgi:hypothetical protein